MVSRSKALVAFISRTRWRQPIRLAVLSAIAIAFSGCGSGSGTGSPSSLAVSIAPTPAPTAAAAPVSMSAAVDCAHCHPTQNLEWRTGPHSYTGISPTFFSLVAAGQNTAAGLLDANGQSVAGAVGNFCVPCHNPHAYIGENGSQSGNNDGTENVQPTYPFVCTNKLPDAVPCTQQTSEHDCGLPGQCNLFEGRSCVNSPPRIEGTDLPRQLRPCTSDADCKGLSIGCDNNDCGPCVIAPSSLYFDALGVEGITCETCHNAQASVRRSCQFFRTSDAIANQASEIFSRATADGQRLRMGPFPVQSTPVCSGGGNDGQPCQSDADCPSGTCGACFYRIKACSGGDNKGLACQIDNDCPMSTSTPTCDAKCSGGVNDGNTCQIDSDCPADPGDTGTCATACRGGTRDGEPFQCSTDSDCPGEFAKCCPNTGATCAGLCAGGAKDGNPCLSQNDCPPGKAGSCNKTKTCSGGKNDGNNCTISADCPADDTPTCSSNPSNDCLPTVENPFHTTARLDSPLSTPYKQTDRPNGLDNPAADPQIIRATELTCPELPYCNGGRCEGGAALGAACASDADCGGCGPVASHPEQGNHCGGTASGASCLTSTDCGTPADPNMTLLDRGIADGTIGPLAGHGTAVPHTIDREDGNFFRSSTACGGCHDVRPPQANMIRRSCQRQKSYLCATDADCTGLVGVGCPGDDCGPCVMENNTAPANQSVPGDPRNTGYRRLENLFSEWEASLYNHPELTFCANDSYKVCTSDTDCGAGGTCNLTSPFGRVVTCQDCHMSMYDDDAGAPVPLINHDGTIVPEEALYPVDVAAKEGSQRDPTKLLPTRRVTTHYMAGVDIPLVGFPGFDVQRHRKQPLLDHALSISLDSMPAPATGGSPYDVNVTLENVGAGHRIPAGFSHERQFWVQMYVQDADKLGTLDPFAASAPCNRVHSVATGTDDTRDPDGAAKLAAAGCVYRSGFILDKAHPETGEMAPDGSLKDEDPEDFLAVTGTRVRGKKGDPRIEVRPGAEGTALAVQHVCARATEEAYAAGIADNTGIDYGTTSFPHQVRFCDPSKSPNPAGVGFTPSGFGNPDCMDNGTDTGPCVEEIELSDANERGRCARDLTRARCQSNDECGDKGPCLYRCENLPELQCCDPNDPNDPLMTCQQYYQTIGVQGPCLLDPRVCVGGSNSGKPCQSVADCPGTGATCGDVGPCHIANRGIVNLQNQFRATANGVCVDPADPRDPTLVPKPVLDAGGSPRSCLINLDCQLAALKTTSGGTAVCLVNGQCESGPNAGKPCTNYTYHQDCGAEVACNVESNLGINGRPTESAFFMSHPFNHNSLPPFVPRTFTYHFQVPPQLSGHTLIAAARIMQRQLPMRFLRNLIGTQVVRPPLIFEGREDPTQPGQCRDPRRIDIDCYLEPFVVLGNAERGGSYPGEGGDPSNAGRQVTQTTTISVQ